MMMQHFYNIQDYGAQPDSETVQTARIQSAIDAASQAGGGTVLISGGAYVSGSLELKNGVELHITQGAKLLGSPYIQDYPDLPEVMHPPIVKKYAWKALIWAKDAHDISITGSGLIDCQGASPDFEVERDEFWGRVENRPFGFYFYRCEDTRMENISMRNSAFWMHHHVECTRMRFININLFNHCHFNNDGLDLDNCSDVIIQGCHIDACDDAICFKSMTPKINENIVISNCVLRSHYNALKIGTESAGGLRNLSISNCYLGGSAVPNHIMDTDSRAFSGIALISADGGNVENITISNCTIQDVEAPVFIRRQHRDRAYYAGVPLRRPAGVMRNIAITQLVVRDVLQASLIFGVPGAPVEDVLLADWRVRCPGGKNPTPESLAQVEVEHKDGGYPDCNVYGELPALGCYVDYANNIELRNLQFIAEEADTRPDVGTGSHAEVKVC